MSDTYNCGAINPENVRITSVAGVDIQGLSDQLDEARARIDSALVESEYNNVLLMDRISILEQKLAALEARDE